MTPKASRASFERAAGGTGARYEDYINTPKRSSFDVKATDLLATETFNTVDIDTILRVLSEAGFPKKVQDEVREIHNKMRESDLGELGEIIKARLSALTEEYTNQNSLSKSASIGDGGGAIVSRSVHQLASDILKTMELADMTIASGSQSRNVSRRVSLHVRRGECRNIETQTSDDVDMVSRIQRDDGLLCCLCWKN